MNIKKAVFPAAGLGTRFLPATKSSPKELLPLVDKPMIQYVVEEAIASEIKDITIVTGRGKGAIEDFFDISFELEHTLKARKKYSLLKDIEHISKMGTISYIRQKEPLGLGHAIWICKDIVGDQPFAVLLGDDIIVNKEPCLMQMNRAYQKYKCPIIAVQKVPKEDIHKYGVIKARPMENNVYQVLDMVEKPTAEEAPSDLAIIGRYILTPEIFTELEQTKEDRTGEIQLTNGLRSLNQKQAVYALEFKGRRYDAGSKFGFLQATVEFALKRPDLSSQFEEYLVNLLSEKIAKKDEGKKGKTNK
ncbi:MAG: UTP--glucose-1-phosphate uridylyltransferase GalU [bacterium]